MKTKTIFIFILIIISVSVFSQRKSENDILKSILQKKVIEYKSEINFKKAQSFFLIKDWDSTLVYSMRQLSNCKNQEIKDFCHFFRGTGFYSKKLYKEAKKEFLLVSNTFTFSTLNKIYLGDVSLELREFKNAISHYEDAKKTPQILSQTYSIGKIYEGLGSTYVYLKEYDKAETYLLNYLKIQEIHHNNIKLFNGYNNIANLYYVQYKDSQAILYFEKAYSISKKVENFSLKNISADNMAVVEENRGNYKEALAYRKESSKWKDSLNNQNKIWSVADYEKKFAVAQKQKEIKVLQVENKLKNTQRNSLFFSAIGLFLILTGGVYLYAQKVKNSKIILLQKNKLDQLNATKDQLFSIVSHDLRSSVNALKTSNSKLSATLETKNYDELNQLIIQNSSIANGTYSLLDNLLHWALLQTKQLYFHKESVHLYSVIQQIEYNYKPLLLDKVITFENSVSKSIFLFADLDSIKIVFRNLLDNAIKYSNENGHITFSTNDINSDFCNLIIEDTGIGMSKNIIAELLQEGELLTKKGNSEIIGTGLGLQLCKQMIKKNDGTFAIESELNKGTKIILTLRKAKQNG